ncbi:ferritin-like domain-containing protein [Pseudanabaena sp. FACHB-2040]|uniref:ferritin-like domain-containing protein n=1 Tax=Pseudanabaena sp. FACHB-2040 TaxID=2692859 RepID=UPI0016825DC4|nr:ferritin-like domain-containing protein [Pseudanabaena sp. FACHB-2040]MBD2258265.1 ferritin-like domain-containing protein [Pseudanabaena sp. FACHB-2040]
MTLQSKRIGQTAFASRRKLLKWGLCGLGAAALTTVPKTVMAQMGRSVKTLTFNADDIGILNFALLLEELEAAFYAAVVRSGKITNPRELEYVRVLGVHEATHVTFLRDVLAENALFQTRDVSFNSTGLAALLTNRDTILNTAVALEDTGVHAYNGAGPSLTNPTYILAAGSIVSVEGRHAAGVRALLGRPVTEPDEDRAISDASLVDSLNPFKGRAYDELYTPKQIVGIVSSLNIINNPINGTLVA